MWYSQQTPGQHSVMARPPSTGMAESSCPSSRWLRASLPPGSPSCPFPSRGAAPTRPCLSPCSAHGHGRRRNGTWPRGGALGAAGWEETQGPCASRRLPGLGLRWWLRRWGPQGAGVSPGTGLALPSSSSSASLSRPGSRRHTHPPRPGRTRGGGSMGPARAGAHGELPRADCPAPAGALPSEDARRTEDTELQRPHPTPFWRLTLLLSQLRTT